jgi:hypothetical protein
MLDTSDQALADLLDSLTSDTDPEEVRKLAGELERMIFHKQTPSPDRKEVDKRL